MLRHIDWICGTKNPHMGSNPLVVVKELHAFLCCPYINLPADVFTWYGVPVATYCDQVIRLDCFRGPYGCLIQSGWKRQEKSLFFFLGCGEVAAFPLLKWTVVELIQFYADGLIQFLKRTYHCAGMPQSRLTERRPCP